MGEAITETRHGPAIQLERGNAVESWMPRLGRGTERFVPLIAFDRPKRARTETIVAAPLPPVMDITEDDLPAREKAAFTLRLDPLRHARLKQACSASSRSAQQIVTQALDAFLATTSSPVLAPATGAAIRTGGF